MEVILLERVAKLGQMGEVVNVKNGYARNFLIPQGKALRSSKASLAIFEAQRAQLEARNLETKGEAEKLAEKLDGQQFIIIRSASDAGSLYGSVTTRDAAEAATAEGFTVDKKQVTLNAPIKELGLHSLEVILHPEVSATICSTIWVPRQLKIWQRMMPLRSKLRQPTKLKHQLKATTKLKSLVARI